MIESQSPNQMQQAHTYTDFSGMDEIRRLGREDEGEALEAVARQFESLFLQQMMDAMRSANEVFAEGNYLHSEETEFFQDMYDKQLTLTMTENDSIGIADALVRQLGGEEQEVNDHVGGKSIEDYSRNAPSPNPELPERVREVDELIEKHKDDGEEADDLPERFDSPDEFVGKLLPLAEKVGDETGVPPRLMLAQAALETGWGQHMMEDDEQGASNNLFGIKADQRWDGDSVSVQTTEYRDGLPLREQWDFRAYEDYESSFRDYVDFLKENPRYERVLENADDPERFAEELQDAGYATDPAYSSKIQGIMDGPVLRSALDRAPGEE